MRHDEKNDIIPNHKPIRRSGATLSWCLVLSIVIGPVCFIDDSEANTCEPSSLEDQSSTQGSASNCQKQDGDLAAHEYDNKRLHFFRIREPFGKNPESVNADFARNCQTRSASCIDYAKAYKNLLKLAYNKHNERDQSNKFIIKAELYFAQLIGEKEVLKSDPAKRVSVRVPVLKETLAGPEKTRLEVHTTLTREGANDHINDEWRLVEVEEGPLAELYNNENRPSSGKPSPSKWTNICGEGRLPGERRLAMVMFGRVDTNYSDSGSLLKLNMVLSLTPKKNKINTDALEMVIVCETAMTAKCAYEHGYRPWAELKDRDNRDVPPEDVAALLSTCALASTRCTEEGNHIVVIDDLGMNRPYPLDYGDTYFKYESTFRYGDKDGPYRERVCRQRYENSSLRCEAHFKHMKEGCDHEGEDKYSYNVERYTYRDQLLAREIYWLSAKNEKVSAKNEKVSGGKDDVLIGFNDLLITDDGKWYAGLGTKLPYRDEEPPPFGIRERRVMIWSMPAESDEPKKSKKSCPGQAGALQEPGPPRHVKWPKYKGRWETDLNPGHIYTTHSNTNLSDAQRYLEKFVWDCDPSRDLKTACKAFDYVSCKKSGQKVACFMYRSKRGKVWFLAPKLVGLPADAAPNTLHWFYTPTSD